MTFLPSLGYGGQVIGAAVILIGALLLWLVVRFLIARSVKRVQDGYSVFKKPHFKWAQPALRSFDSARRVQRAETIGGLMSSIAAGTIAVVAILMAIETPRLQHRSHPGERRHRRYRDRFRRQGGHPRRLPRLLHHHRGPVRDRRHHRGGRDTVGVVQSLGLRITRMVDGDGAIWYVRNGDITKVGNRSQGDYVAPPAEPAAPAAAATEGQA
ncbi:hypothetical protein MN0502_18680 [Arthrobacter sp. MN05-02]|nr:hypothetical protein MN0502_18680 [Arthrobacter sp. MN05-02]